MKYEYVNKTMGAGKVNIDIVIIVDSEVFWAVSRVINSAVIHWSLLDSDLTAVFIWIFILGTEKVQT